MAEKLKAFICDFASISPENIKDNLNLRTDLCLDSISVLNLIVAIENEFEIEIGETELNDVNTFGEFAKLLESKIK